MLRVPRNNERHKRTYVTNVDHTIKDRRNTRLLITAPSNDFAFFVDAKKKQKE